MKSLIHQHLATAGQQALALRRLPAAPLRLPPELQEHQSFVDRVYHRSQNRPLLLMKGGNSSSARP